MSDWKGADVVGYVGGNIRPERKRQLMRLLDERGRSLREGLQHAVDLLLAEGFPAETEVPRDLEPTEQ